MLKRYWEKISYIGIIPGNENSYTKENILTNQINFIITILVIFGLILLKTESSISESPMEMGSLRVLLIGISSIISLIFAYYGYHKLRKLFWHS